MSNKYIQQNNKNYKNEKKKNRKRTEGILCRLKQLIIIFSSNRKSAIPVPEDLSITRIAGLSWDQWNARLALPLVTQLREGLHPLLFPTDLTINPVSSESSMSMSPNKSLLSPENGGQGHTCNDCGRVYKLKSSLRNHQKWECMKEPQFQCPFCVYRAKQKMHIGRHMERMHKKNAELLIAAAAATSIKKEENP